MWESSDIQISEDINTHALGLTWNKRNTLIVSSYKDTIVNKITHRIILFASQHVFDSIGLTLQNSFSPKFFCSSSVAQGKEDSIMKLPIKL